MKGLNFTAPAGFHFYVQISNELFIEINTCCKRIVGAVYSLNHLHCTEAANKLRLHFEALPFQLLQQT